MNDLNEAAIQQADIIFFIAQDRTNSLVWGEEFLKRVIATGKANDGKILIIERDDLTWDQVRKAIAEIKGKAHDGQHRHGKA